MSCRWFSWVKWSIIAFADEINVFSKAAPLNREEIARAVSLAYPSGSLICSCLTTVLIVAFFRVLVASSFVVSAPAWPRFREARLVIVPRE